MTRFHLLYALVLIPFAVAAGSTGLLLTTLQLLSDDGHPASKALRLTAFVSAIPFFVETGILDALIWPFFYPSW